MKNLIAAIACILLLGAGCVPGPDASKAQANAEALDLRSGDRFTIAQTAFGIDALASLVFGSSGTREVTLTEWNPGDSVRLTWTMTEKRETATSQERTKAYEALPPTPVGEEAPVKPTPEYEDVTIGGAMGTDALEYGTTLALPLFWQASDVGDLNAKTIIWLSGAQYAELSETRSTHVSLGLFDASLSDVLNATNDLRRAVAALQQSSQEASETEDVLKVTAQDDWGTYKLKVNGETQIVRTVEASNWFGRYTILANRENPLILKLTLNPAALAGVNDLTVGGILQSFVGYEITEITVAPSTE